jgi:hypothetical protein
LSELSDIADGCLAAAGLIDPGGLIKALRRAAAGLTGGLWLLDAAIACEAWMRAQRSTALPVWEDVSECVGSAVLTT